jgi:hypothetical protein
MNQFVPNHCRGIDFFSLNDFQRFGDYHPMPFTLPVVQGDDTRINPVLVALCERAGGNPIAREVGESVILSFRVSCKKFDSKTVGFHFMPLVLSKSTNSSKTRGSSSK